MSILPAHAVLKQTGALLGVEFERLALGGLRARTEHFASGGKKGSNYIGKAFYRATKDVDFDVSQSGHEIRKELHALAVAAGGLNEHMERLGGRALAVAKQCQRQERQLKSLRSRQADLTSATRV